MILFFGTRPGKKMERQLPGVSCPHCSQVGTLTLVSRPNYFHLFWLPLFTIQTSRYAECSHCKRVYHEDEFTAEMKRSAS
ncbi:zinc ribbon domain-containing protein [Muricauda sp. SCSIO 64092]|uniref:zinc-ribbon domain-containing protein n=1 Tax=Allomuricauda sp. SCSIO 64092 TaxID=2908842 RepID=UPI001FF6DAD1|nr:zinc-ribbon domain-containing protein [Muricauda sp. SCSIO 64092]UOY07602.1 zinc ribbon domain-containing protein [Muricauda sp. SCSIO 64092]